MDVTVIEEMVSNVAFPIAAFALMYYMMNTTIKELRQTISDNTVMLNKIYERLGDYEKTTSNV